MVGFTIPRAFVSMDPWSGTLLVGMPRGVTLPDGRDVGGYSLRKYADEREKTDWRGEEGIRVTLDDGFPARLQRGRGDDVEAVFVDASVLADAVKTRLDSALRAVEDMDWTPDFGIDVQKWDRKSGWPNGDRDNSKDALTVSGDTEIVFTITNTSKTDPDTKQGAVFRTKDIKLEDSTIVGDGEVVDLKYPADWDTKVLKPGESVEITGTLKGVTKTHTDRAKVTGTPLTECPVDTSAPFDDGTSADESGSKPEAETESKSDDVVTIDGKDYCSDTKVESATDDWNGYRKSLAQTGAGIVLIALAAVVVLGGGAALMAVSRRRKAPQADDKD